MIKLPKNLGLKCHVKILRCTGNISTKQLKKQYVIKVNSVKQRKRMNNEK